MGTTSSPEVLEYGLNERRAILLEKLGGKEVLHQAIDKFYNRQMNDPKLAYFFRNTDVQILKWHQMNFMSIVFSHVPANFDIERLLLTTHSKLFDDGLSEHHFDLVTEHFTATLNEMKVEEQLIQEALDFMTPVRNIFVNGAEQARQRQRLFKRNHHVVVGIVVSALAVGVFQLLKSSRKK